MSENEALLKRLQEQSSVYNVYDWEHQRKQQVKMVKNICYHPPSLLKKSRKKSTRRGSGFESAKNEPNRQLFELYQTSLRASQQDPSAMDFNSSMAMPTTAGGEDSVDGGRRPGAGEGGSLALHTAGQSTDMGTGMLPEVNPHSSKGNT